MFNAFSDLGISRYLGSDADYVRARNRAGGHMLNLGKALYSSGKIASSFFPRKNIKSVLMAPIPPTPVTPTPFRGRSRSVVSNVSKRARSRSASRGSTGTVVMKARSRSRGRTMSRGKRSISRSRTRSRTSKKSLAGGSAFTGSIDEEDRAIKKHMKYGVVYEVGTANEISSSHGIGITHANFPERSVLIAIFMALVKKLINMHGGVIKNWEDSPIYPGAYTPSQVFFTLRFEYCDNLGIITQDNIQLLVTPANYTSWYSIITYGLTASANFGLVELFINKFQANPIRLFQVTKFGVFDMIYANATVGVGQAGAIGIDLDCSKFNVDLVSNMVYQNRSVADDGSTSAVDVDQLPLFEVNCYGVGTMAIQRTAAIGGVQTLPEPINTETGVHGIGFTVGAVTDKHALGEPSKGKFINVKFVRNTMSNPGVIKSEKLKSHYVIKFSDIVQKMRGFTQAYTNLAIPAPQVRNMLGRFCYHWFRKTIDLTGSTNCKISYQHHWAAGVTVMVKKDTSTGPYVGKIQ